MLRPSPLHVFVLDRRMLDALLAGGLALEVLARQRAIDPERRACALRRRDDRQLHVLDDVAGDEHARDARRLVLARLDATLPRELAAERLREPRLTAARRIEVQRLTRKSPPAAKHDAFQLAAAAFQALDPFLG